MRIDRPMRENKIRLLLVQELVERDVPGIVDLGGSVNLTREVRLCTKNVTSPKGLFSPYARRLPMCLTLDSCFSPRQVDDCDVMSKRRVVGKRGPAACFGIIGMPTNADDVQLA